MIIYDSITADCEPSYILYQTLIITSDDREFYSNEFIIYWTFLLFEKEKYVVHFKGKGLLILNETTHPSHAIYDRYDSPENFYRDTICGSR